MNLRHESFRCEAPAEIPMQRWRVVVVVVVGLTASLSLSYSQMPVRLGWVAPVFTILGVCCAVLCSAVQFSSSSSALLFLLLL